MEKQVNRAASQKSIKTEVIQEECPSSKTSFGKLVLSTEKSEPVFSIGHCTRDSLAKTFETEELSARKGTQGPGPKYAIKDNKNFRKQPRFSVGKDPRNTTGKLTSYEHFNHIDKADAPYGKNYVMRKSASCKFGTEKRVTDPFVDYSPGPYINPPHRSDIKSSPKFTLGQRRNLPGQSGLENLISTPRKVGPGQYRPESSALTSIHKSAPINSFTKARRRGLEWITNSKHQTYDTK